MIGAGLLNIDFAALRTLRTVYRLNSFTDAAAELDVNQSTISYTVERLRRALDDQLFVRQAGGLVATDRCQAVMATVDQIWSEAERLASPGSFDPVKTTETISVSATFLSRAAIMPRVLQCILDAAPNLQVVINSGFASARQGLIDGTVDIALTPVNIEESGVHRRVLLQDQYVCAMSPENKLAEQELTLERYAKASHLFIDYGSA